MSKTGFALESFLPYMLNQASEASSLAFQNVYKGRYGMLRTEWRVLFRANLHKTKISRAVHRLAERRFVARVRDGADRRVEHLSLTSKGVKAYKDLRQTAEQYEAQLLAAFSPQETTVLRRALVKLAATRPDSFT